MKLHYPYPVKTATSTDMFTQYFNNTIIIQYYKTTIFAYKYTVAYILSTACI